MSDSLIWRLPQARSKFFKHFFAGGLFAYPTEAVYGIGANPSDALSVQRLIELKQRPVEKGLIMTASTWQQCEGFIAPIDAQAQAMMEALNAERPTTFILPAGEKVAEMMKDAETGRVALRISRHAVIRSLCEVVGQPIVSTSANLAGHAPALNVHEVQAYFPTLPCIAGDLGGALLPSRILDWQTQTYIRM